MNTKHWEVGTNADKGQGVEWISDRLAAFKENGFGAAKAPAKANAKSADAAGAKKPAAKKTDSKKKAKTSRQVK
jgi:hypothetical protein